MKVLCVCGARPNFMKVAPLVAAFRRIGGVETSLVHTGQHYDDRLSRLFFEDLQIPEPDLNLTVGSGSHAVQTAEIMRRFEPVCLEYAPDWVIVVGDVNSTLAAALVASKLNMPVAHVEAGLRSFDRTMPEEINRMLTDAISDLLFVSEPSGVVNLRREGVPEERIHYAGNVMIDTLRACRARADDCDVLARVGVEKGRYAVVTLHRPANVDDRATFLAILHALDQISRDMPVVFPVHPRTRQRLQTLSLRLQAECIEHLHLIAPLGYLDFLKLLGDACVVLTDSGGIQEETTILNIPCLTLRENTERPITVTHGTNRLTGSATDAILAAYHDVRRHPPKTVVPPEGWDGHAAERIVGRLTGCPLEWFQQEETATGAAVTAEHAHPAGASPI